MIASQEVKETRLAICEKCEFNEPPKCTQCGCYISKKVLFTLTKCPVGKW